MAAHPTTSAKLTKVLTPITKSGYFLPALMAPLLNSKLISGYRKRYTMHNQAIKALSES